MLTPSLVFLLFTIGALLDDRKTCQDRVNLFIPFLGGSRYFRREGHLLDPTSFEKKAFE